jgi:LCP family protein required for cell wall assembly
MGEWPEDWFRGGQPANSEPDAADNTVSIPAGQAGGSSEGTAAGQYQVRDYGADAGSSSAAPTAWPDQPPAKSEPGSPWRSRVHGAPGRTGWRRWTRPKRVVTILAALVALIIVGTVGTYFYLNSKLNRSVTLPAFSGQSDGQNWLIVGADTRSGLTDQQIRAFHVGFRFGFNTSDSLMLVHIGGPRPVLISIPRDSYVPIPGYGYNKINAALSFGGPSLLIKTVENVTGLRINHYMGIGFVGLVNTVNGIGGVRMCLPTALRDSYSGADFSAGCHNLDGVQALEFVRDRHSFAVEDLQRIEDQRAFLEALLDKARSPGVFLNPFEALPFGTAAASSISVDKGTDLYQLLQVALALRNPETGTVPVANPNYLTANAGDALLWNRSEALQLFAALQKDQPVPAGLLTGTVVG